MGRLTWLIIFGMGIVVGIQLASMYANLDYDAAWWKVAVAALIAVAFFPISRTPPTEG